MTCVSSDRKTVHDYLSRLTAAGIQNIMALRGDILPEKMNEDRSSWDYRHAVDLIRDIRSSDSQITIGGACYP